MRPPHLWKPCGNKSVHVPVFPTTNYCVTWCSQGDGDTVTKFCLHIYLRWVGWHFMSFELHYHWPWSSDLEREICVAPPVSRLSELQFLNLMWPLTLGYWCALAYLLDPVTFEVRCGTVTLKCVFHFLIVTCLQQGHVTVWVFFSFNGKMQNQCSCSSSAQRYRYS